MQIQSKSLNRQDFAPFGEIVEPGGDWHSANAGMARRFSDVVTLETRRGEARPNLAIFEVEPYDLPFAIEEMEQHPYSTQTFLPLAAARYMIVVCAAGQNGLPDPAAMHAFVVGQQVGISYRVGIWHHAIMALDQPARFTSLTWEDGSSGDCNFHRLDAPVLLTE
ncbi:MAG: ureidoglycolate lyase [Alphaproteobacteria bacterium]